MSAFQMKLPDVGEGVATAELVAWHVAVGDEVTTATVLADVLTDKATVEISSPVSGVVVELHGEPGDQLAVGGVLVTIETGGAAPPDDAPAADASGGATPPAPEPATAKPDVAVGEARPSGSGRVLSTPPVRKRAAELGIDLATVPGTGPGGRVTRADLDRVIEGGGDTAPPGSPAVPGDRTVEVRGVRRQIARRLSASWRAIPHITYVDSVDATALEQLRAELNDGREQRLTLLPFIGRAIAIAVADQPHLNSHYDQDTDTLTEFGAVHLGVATQTDDGLRVPVVRNAGSLGLWELGNEIARLAGAARSGSATRDDLTGSTISVTSLGALGGLMSTPLINAPEVAIVGVNKIEVRPVWIDGAFIPRRMFNLSCSFDHRIVDGWDAAVFVQRLITLLQSPALLFIGTR